MSPLEARPSHDGPVHPTCLRLEDHTPPAISPASLADNIAPVPAYGLPPWSPARIAPFALLAATTAGAWWYLHNP